MCPPPRLVVTINYSGMIWTPYDWFNNFYICYMATNIGVINGRGLGIDMCRGNQPNKSKVALYKALIHCNRH